ncbi:MAG: hypothetical protein IRZ07_31075 [Microbispora sp.]|nr:hypothetical protein [Microbispora sp.]
MTVSVVIPWRPGCPHRKAALAWVLPRWQATGWQVVVAEQSDGGPWCKARAVAVGLSEARGDVLVVADADVWCPKTAAAVGVVERGATRWAVPHRLVYRLSGEATRRVLGGEQPHKGMGLAQEPYTGLAGGGITVVRRDVYAEVPLDPRFLGWGQEDESWAHALTVLAGRPWRGVAPLWHLWHPPQERLTRRWGSRQGRELAARYGRARTADRVRALLAEIP